MATKKCRVCDQEYEACRTAKSPVGAFRWRDVACSRECGEIYLARIIASRSKNVVEPEPEQPSFKDNEVAEVTEDLTTEIDVVDDSDEDDEVFVDGIEVDDEDEDNE